MVLKEIKESHEKIASTIPGWERMNKNDLANAYIVNEGNKKLSEAYFSALVCKYWWTINKYKILSGKSFNDSTIYYDWLIDGLMKALKRRKWLDKSSKMYSDPNGPDKIINRCLKSVRLGWYQVQNYSKRRANFMTDSLENMLYKNDDDDSVSGEKFISSKYLDLEEYFCIQSLMNQMLRGGEYVALFIISGVINHNVFNSIIDEDGKRYLEFNKKRLAHYLKNLDNYECETISVLYRLPMDELIVAKDYCLSLSRFRLLSSIDRGLHKLQEVYVNI